MSAATPKRTSPTRKVTRKTEERRAKELDNGFRIKIAGDEFEVRLRDIPNRLVGDMRAQCGTTPLAVLRTLEAGVMDLDVVGQFVWLARRMRGEDVAYDDVELTYGDMLDDDFDVTDLEGEAPEPDPET